ncbi:MAG: filamentous hemagglutinin N-terminal domain-containing protein [Scytonema sp. PMC 1069.18]|nr:filamentous hemagglutinin N-terminal domain-containing protein [Scytonema sp. PMC 1069.18]MEC4880470.1 filamentous hemagglutinin N-terminal domain-containing protein [Scytonema sp. PMC 1070.18]
MYWNKTIQWLSFVAPCVGLIFTNSVSAQSNIQPDNSLGVESSSVQQNFLGLPIEAIIGGAIRDSNLFHSFKEFNVSQGRSAYFLSPNINIKNIFSRVTGGKYSEILGTLGTLQILNGRAVRPDVNLYLINPAGIIFGENARLDIGGSFIATTADAVEFNNQGFFSASNPGTPQLLTINPSAFLFNQISPAPIINRSRAVSLNNPSLQIGLAVPYGKELFLLGGDVILDGGLLQAFGGKISVGGLSGPGEIGISSTDSNSLDLSFPQNVSYADIDLKNQAILDVSGLGGGEVRLIGNNINISSGSIRSLNIGNQNSGDIKIQATQFNISDANSALSTVTNNSGNSGNILIDADKINISDLAAINTLTSGTGKGGEILINGQDLNISGLSSITTLTNSAGNSGNILIDVENLNMQNIGNISSTSFFQGNTGNVTVSANNINLDNSSTIATLSLSVGNVTEKTSSGNVSIDAQNLNLQNTSAIIVNSLLGQGNPGNLTLEVAEKINLSNSRISTLSFSSAAGGDIQIATAKLYILDGSQIATSVINPNSDDFFSNVQQNLGNFDPALQSSIISILQTLIIDTDTNNPNNLGQANSGNLNIRAGNSIILRGTSPDGKTVNTISTETQGRGKAGNLGLDTRQLIVSDGSAISTQTINAGDGGNLSINVDSLELTGNAQIIAESTGTGQAGNIDMNASGLVSANNSNITTSSLQSSGGIINIKAENIRLFGDTNIRTNVFTGAGGGGNITLTANSIIALNDSDIFSFARDGKGGDIRFNTRAFLSLPLYNSSPATTDISTLDSLDRNQRVDVNASGGISGTISGIPDVTFLQNSLTELPQNVLDVNALIATSCIVRRNNRQEGTFFVTGKGGLPERPGDAPLSPYPTGAMQSLSTQRPRWKIGDPIVEPQGIYQLPNGQKILSRECSQ